MGGVKEQPALAPEELAVLVHAVLMSDEELHNHEGEHSGLGETSLTPYSVFMYLTGGPRASSTSSDWPIDGVQFSSIGACCSSRGNISELWEDNPLKGADDLPYRWTLASKKSERRILVAGTPNKRKYPGSNSGSLPPTITAFAVPNRSSLPRLHLEKKKRLESFNLLPVSLLFFLIIIWGQSSTSTSIAGSATGTAMSETTMLSSTSRNSKEYELEY
ncbi:uncharacterized protein EV420DRAFT_1483409 [Desarmillaria tabescens]|uniref:Uncharacterized protein n=1 Tax=Armillaria tabescens TaxID=1929756 RepID=A0AA39MVQ1_ARMTA|nr:uncharacterized protein EV420DRAFT_1483409 [Desarmillaria tabescens]KAK0448397.1 hypothetical protein EV420DRAFT_1483409 [Desarmillaria tabescens]